MFQKMAENKVYRKSVTEDYEQSRKGHKMKLHHRQEGQIHVVCVAGKIDTSIVPEFGQEMDEIVAGGDRSLLLDLSGVTYISSGGLRVILATAKRLKEPGDRFAVCGLSDEVRGVFEIAGFTRILRVYPTAEDAAGSL